MKKLPGLLIAGIKKCGTGALLEILKMHPERERFIDNDISI